MMCHAHVSLVVVGTDSCNFGTRMWAFDWKRNSYERA